MGCGCAVSGEIHKVRHMNRGIAAEGFGCLIASLFGGIPVTSYTQNIGVIATTRIASRFVVQIAALILMLYGLSPKVGAPLGGNSEIGDRDGLLGGCAEL